MKKLAILCAYRLLPDRVGGMDYFFWKFDYEAKKLGWNPVWFFPNNSEHGQYSELHIVSSEGLSVEDSFLSYNQKFDYVFTHFLELCTPFYKMARPLVKKNFIAVDHNPRPLGGYPFKKRIEKRVKGLLYGCYIDRFVGVSNYTVKELIADFGCVIRDRTTCIYNGIIAADIQVRTDRKTVKPKFVVVSHLRETKGIQDLVAAVSLLEENIKKELQIDVFGSGPYEEALFQLCDRFEVRQNFNFRGNSPTIKQQLANYDYLLQPTHMECFSLSILESLAANVPVITTPVGGNKEAVHHGKNGLILPAKNVNAWVIALEKLWRGSIVLDSNVSDTIRKHFSLENMVQNYLKLLQ